MIVERLSYLIEQRFLTGDDCGLHPQRGRGIMSGDILGCHNLEGTTGSGWTEVRAVLHILCCIGQLPAAEYYPAPSVSV